MVFTNHTCPNDNREVIDQSSFWDTNGINWDTHRIGWAIAGGCAALTVLISAFNVFMHARYYTNRVQQRQIIRVLYMPPVYAVISFFSYRFFRDYTYYSLAETTYEAVTLSAFLLLLIDFVASTASSHKAESAILRKDKTALPIPFCCWRFRPTKAYFMYTLKWSVLQYVIIRPAISIAGVITQAYGVLCESGSYSIYFAAVYLDSIDFVSISVSLYGLIIFYALTKEELAGRQPLAKFLSIKLIVFFTFYQGFVFDVLQSHGVIKSTQYWTATNIADGLNALATCIEMVFFSALMVWAYNWKPYTDPVAPRLGFFRALWDSINYADFAREIWGSIKFFVDYWRGKKYTHGVPTEALDDIDQGAHGQTTFGQAFGVEGYSKKVSKRSNYPPRTSYDETIRLQPYPPS